MINRFLYGNISARNKMVAAKRPHQRGGSQVTVAKKSGRRRKSLLQPGMQSGKPVFRKFRTSEDSFLIDFRAAVAIVFCGRTTVCHCDIHTFSVFQFFFLNGKPISLVTFLSWYSFQRVDITDFGMTKGN